MNSKMNIYYYFEVSNKKQRRLQFKGKSVSAYQVITEILKENKGFDRDEIRIFDAQTDMEFHFNDPITRNTQLVVRRIQRQSKKQKMPKGPSNWIEHQNQVKKKKSGVSMVPEKELTKEEKEQQEEKERRKKLKMKNKILRVRVVNC